MTTSITYTIELKVLFIKHFIKHTDFNNHILKTHPLIIKDTSTFYVISNSKLKHTILEI